MREKVVDEDGGHKAAAITMVIMMMKYCDEEGIAQVKNSILYRVYLKYETNYDW